MLAVGLASSDSTLFRTAAASIDRSLARLGLPKPGTRISAFHPFDGEIDPGVVLLRAARLGCRIYYPVVTSLRNRRMRFVASADHPDRDRIDPRWLDLVLMPLVGFDARAHRLGMGAGLYDRHFAFLRHRRAWRRPLLVGIAFAVFWGTMFPVISEAVRGVKITVGPPFFNKVNAPLGLGGIWNSG